jgi:hypothetical protein
MSRFNLISLAVIMMLIITNVLQSLKMQQLYDDNTNLKQRIVLYKHYDTYSIEYIPDSIRQLAHAMLFVESSGNDTVVQRNTKAVGCMQIRKIMVDEVNRICKLNKHAIRFEYADRYDRRASLTMFSIWYRHHHVHNTLQHIARNWNGGPAGFKAGNTINYWLKVRKRIRQTNYHVK